MKNMLKVLGFTALVAVIVFTMAACNFGGGKTATLLNECDKALDDLESALKKIKAGDNSRAADLEKLSARVEEKAEQLDSLSENDFTLAQKAKMATLYVRIAAMTADYALYRVQQRK